MISKAQAISWIILSIFYLLGFIFVSLKERKYTKMEKFMYCAPSTIVIFISVIGYCLKWDKTVLIIVSIFSFLVMPSITRIIFRE